MSYQVQQKPLAWFRENPENYRSHPPEQIEVLRQSLKRFGVFRNAKFIHCEKYYPAKPECVNDTTRAVTTPTSGKQRENNIATAKEWGAKVVQWLETLRAKDTA